MPVVISIKNLVKTYIVGEVEVRALRGVSLDVQRGRVRRRSPDRPAPASRR